MSVDMPRNRYGHPETNNSVTNPLAPQLPCERLPHYRHFPLMGKARVFLGQMAAELELAAEEMPDSPGNVDEEKVVGKLCGWRWGEIEAPDMSD